MMVLIRLLIEVVNIIASLLDGVAKIVKGVTGSTAALFKQVELSNEFI
jgi:hypothetical protein